MQNNLPDNLKPLLEKGAVTAGLRGCDSIPNSPRQRLPNKDLWRRKVIESQPLSVDEFVLQALLSSNQGLFSSFDELDEVDAKREQALIEGFESGQPIPIAPEFWQERHRVLQERIAAQSKAS